MGIWHNYVAMIYVTMVILSHHIEFTLYSLAEKLDHRNIYQILYM